MVMLLLGGRWSWPKNFEGIPVCNPSATVYFADALKEMIVLKEIAISAGLRKRPANGSILHTH